VVLDLDEAAASASGPSGEKGNLMAEANPMKGLMREFGSRTLFLKPLFYVFSLHAVLFYCILLSFSHSVCICSFEFRIPHE
jgi:hypothetical protein